MAAAWDAQLAAGSIPLPRLMHWVVPVAEMSLGAALLAGFHTRLASLLALGIMGVASYVHLVADDPALYPFQSPEPAIPALVIVLSLYLLAKGGGAGSLDLKAAGPKPRGPRQPSSGGREAG